MKSYLLVLALTLSMQGIAEIGRNILVLIDDVVAKELASEVETN